MSSVDPTLALSALTIVGSLGVAFGVARGVSSSEKDKLTRVDRTLAKHVEDDHEIQLEMVGRLARIETKLDIMLRETANDDE